jgi:hypothetical protein
MPANPARIGTFLISLSPRYPDRPDDQRRAVAPIILNLL